MRKLLRAFMLIAALSPLACASRPEARNAPLPPAPPQAPRPSNARGHITVALLTADLSGTWGVSMGPPEALLTELANCHRQALDAGDGQTTGWLRARIPATLAGGYARAAHLDDSGLPAPLVQCAVQALQSATPPAGLEAPAHVMYASFE